MTLLAPDPARSTTLFAAHLDAHGEQPAVVHDGGVVTYAELDERVGDLAERLGTVRRLVAVEAANTLDALVAYLGALRGDHPVLLLPPGAAAGSDDGLAGSYAPDVVLRASGGWRPEERATDSGHELHPDLALLLSTSGSTGSAKLVRLSRDNVQSNATAIAQYLGLTSDDRAMTTLPMQYCYGLSVVNNHLTVGASITLTDLSVVDPCFWDRFQAVGATSFAGVPYTFDLLDRVGFDTKALPTLRHVTQAGGRLAPARVRAYAELARRAGWRFYVMYGQTEATARMAYLPPELAATHPEAIGVPIPGGSFSIDPGDGAADGHEGELVYRGPNVMLGYAHGPTDLRLGRTVDALHTGDLARRRPDGLYEITGRKSRFVKPFGVRIDLDHLERRLTEAGTPVLCTGDDQRLVVAVEEVENVADVADVADVVATAAGLPASRVQVVPVEALPRRPNGKPDHEAVRQLAARPADHPAVGGDATPSAGRDAVRALFADVLGHPVTDDDSFVSAGGDSLSYVELSVSLEERLGPLPRDWHLRPIRALAANTARRRSIRWVETSVVLRAVAIVLIVGTHADAWYLPGGAHTLIGIAGYNFARFQLGGTGMARSIARIVIPSIAWISLVAAASADYGWPHALLVNGIVGHAGDRWSYWFIEALVCILVPLAFLLAVPKIRRLERGAPFRVALVVSIAALAIRFDVVALPELGHRTSRPHEVLWLFALGWAAAVADRGHQRLVVSVLVVAAAVDFFSDPHRGAMVAAGLLLVVWVPNLPLPALCNRVTGLCAAASLHIYLTHWQVYPPVLRHLGPPAAIAVSLLVGVAAWALADAAADRISRATGRIAAHEAPRA